MSTYLSDLGGLLAAVTAVVIAVLCRRQRAGVTRKVLGKIASARGFAIVAVGLLSLGVNLFAAWSSLVPLPQVHDEFSYLLGADTFAHGRWTNPTHPLWEHLESFHTIQRPSYQSKYPPAQAVFLAIGQRLAGHPIAGVWLSLALACAATCWMLQAWLPPRWALLGGTLAALHPRILEYWGQAYWGGAVAMLGGALVFGAVRRLSANVRIGDALALATGLVLLANSRPYEGLVASLPVAALILAWLFLKDKPWRAACGRRFVVPVVGVLTAAAATMGYFHYRVTGDPLKTPYQAWAEQYSPQGSMSLILFRYQPITKPEPARTITFPTGAKKLHPKDSAIVKCAVDWIFFVGASFAVPLLGALVVLRRPQRSRAVADSLNETSLGRPARNVFRIRGWTAFALAAMALVYGAYLAEWAPPHAHYIAPVTCLFFFTVIQAFRHLRARGRRPGSLGRALAGAVLPAVVAALAITIWQIADKAAEFHRTKRGPWFLCRDQIAQRLTADPHKHLIVVRYLPGHQIDDEWVFNGADIDDAKIVWARELTPEKNDRLVEHFNDRRIWLLEPDATDLRLTPHRRPVADKKPTALAPQTAVVP